MTEAASAPPLVLVVDDNTGFLRAVRGVLERGSPPFRVRTAETAEEALAYLHDAPGVGALRPSFVLLDFHLPDLDAPEVLMRMRAHPSSASLPVLVLSQADWPEDETAALAAGGTQFLPKPSTAKELRSIVEGFWEREARVAPGATAGHSP